MFRRSKNRRGQNREQTQAREKRPLTEQDARDARERYIREHGDAARGQFEQRGDA